MRAFFAFAVAFLLFSVAPIAFAFTMSVQPARIQAEQKEVEFAFDFNGLKDGNYSIAIAVPECGLEAGACAQNYSSVVPTGPKAGECAYDKSAGLVKCSGTILGATLARVSFTATNDAAGGKPKQRASEKWVAQVDNAGKTEAFSQSIQLDWKEQARDSNAGAQPVQESKAESPKQKAFALSAQDFVLAIEAIIVIALIAYLIGRIRKRATPRRHARRSRKAK